MKTMGCILRKISAFRLSCVHIECATATMYLRDVLHKRVVCLSIPRWCIDGHRQHAVAYSCSQIE